MANKLMSDVSKLNAVEPLLLVEAVGDSIAAVPEAVILTDKQTQKLDRRLESYHEHPEAVSTWEKVRDRIIGHS